VKKKPWKSATNDQKLAHKKGSPETRDNDAQVEKLSKTLTARPGRTLKNCKALRDPGQRYQSTNEGTGWKRARQRKN